MRVSPATATVLMISFLFSIVWVGPGIWHFAELGNPTSGILVIMICLPAVVPCWMYWSKFRFPPTPAAIVAGTTIFFLNLAQRGASFDGPGLPDYSASIVALLVATGTLIAGTWWDLTDIRRETERSQVAFWLHCCAGFLLTRALFSLLTGHRVIDNSPVLTGLELYHFPYVLAMIAIGGLISLLLDRRSLLVGVLLPTAGMFKALGSSQTETGYVEFGTITGLAVAGCGLLFFSWGWQWMRRNLLAVIPIKLAAQLPRTNLQNTDQRPTRRHLQFWRTKSSSSFKYRSD